MLALFSKLVDGIKASGVRAPISVRCENVPIEALGLLEADLAAFDCEVIYHSNRSGLVQTHSGLLEFFHDGESLTVAVMEDRGHFPRALLIGGIKQMISEATERVHRASDQKLNVVAFAEGSANA